MYNRGLRLSTVGQIDVFVKFTDNFLIHEFDEYDNGQKDVVMKMQPNIYLDDRETTKKSPLRLVGTLI